MKRRVEFSRDKISNSNLLMYSKSNSYQYLGTISKKELFKNLSTNQKTKIDKLFCSSCTENGCKEEMCDAVEFDIVLVLDESKI